MTALEQETYVHDPDLDGPMKAHLTWRVDPYTGLCGARLLGIDPPPDCPKCEKCKEIRAQLENNV